MAIIVFAFCLKAAEGVCFTDKKVSTVCEKIKKAKVPLEKDDIKINGYYPKGKAAKKRLLKKQ